MKIQYKIKCDESKEIILEAVQNVGVDDGYEVIQEKLEAFVQGEEIDNSDEYHPYPACDSTAFDLSMMLDESLEMLSENDYQGLEGIHNRLGDILEKGMH